MTKPQLIRTPVIPRNKADPTQLARPVNRMFRDNDDYYHRIKVALKQLFDERFTGRERVINQTSQAVHGNVIYQANAGAYIYDMTATQLADLLQRVQIILNDALLERGGNHLWALSYIADEYERDTY
ncbi:hypothetical protein PANNVG_01645 [Pantoea sp. Nvir]